MEEGGILILPNLLYSTYDIIFFSKKATMQVGFEFRKKEKNQMELISVSKWDRVVIKNCSWLLQLPQPEQYQWVHYPGVRA